MLFMVDNFYKVQDLLIKSRFKPLPKSFKHWLFKTGFKPINKQTKSKQKYRYVTDGIFDLLTSAESDEICLAPAHNTDNTDDYFICIEMPTNEQSFLNLISEIRNSSIEDIKQKYDTY